MPKVAVINLPYFGEAYVDRIRKAGSEVVDAGSGRSEDEVAAGCADAEIVMCMGLAPFTEKVFAALPKLTFLQQCTVGYDRVDTAAATKHGVMVANSPFFCIEEVSDHASMLILAMSRRLPHQLDALKRNGWDFMSGFQVMRPVHRIRGRTLGFVAFGRIARLVAEKLSGFGLSYLAHDPFLKQADVDKWKVRLVSLDELCRESDVISMHALLNDQTRGMFGEAQLRAMKADASFVNTSRGPTVDEAALIKALREGWIAGAGLDVLEKEPPDADNPLLTMPNVLTLTHTAGQSIESAEDNRRQTTEQVLRVLGGEWPTVLVNADVKERARFRPLVPA